MKIFVCVKHVPDTAASIKLESDTAFDDSQIKFVANPYDEYGLEEAVTLVEKHGGEVVVVTLAKPEAVATIRGALAMGADRGILVETDEQFTEPGLSARILKAVIEEDGPGDIIFTGKGSVDTESFQTQYRLARLLNLPVVNEVSALKIDGDRALAERETGGGEKQVLQMSLPCVIGATKGLNEPRYPKFPDIMKAKKKPVKQIRLSELDPGESKPGAILEKLEPVPERSGAKMLEGSVNDQVDELIRILKEEEKVI